MNAAMGWIVALLLVVAGGYFLWYAPMQQSASTQTGNTSGELTGTVESSGDPQFVGTWQSNSDASFTREIRADGVIVDRYEGDASAGINGEWTAVNPVQEPLLSDMAASLANKTVIRVVWEGGVETTYFVVSDVSGNSLTTTDLTGRGAVTVYTKI